MKPWAHVIAFLIFCHGFVYVRFESAPTPEAIRQVQDALTRADHVVLFRHPHPEKNTLSLSGIRPIRESLIGLVEAPDGRRREQWLSKMSALGRRAA